MNAEEALKFNDNHFINTPNKEIDNRWNALPRLYSVDEVIKLRGSVNIEYSLPKADIVNIHIFRKYLNTNKFWRVSRKI